MPYSTGTQSKSMILSKISDSKGKILTTTLYLIYLSCPINTFYLMELTSLMIFREVLRRLGTVIDALSTSKP